MPSAEEWDAQGLDKYGLIAVNAKGNAAQVEKVSHATGKYSKRRRSNVAVIIIRIVCISSFLFYCLLLNHSFKQTQTGLLTALNLFSLLQLYNYIAPASLF